MRMRAIVIFGLVFLGVGAVARADDKSAGKAIWNEGITRYDLGDFDGAIARFEEAYKTFPNPSILFNLGQAHRQKKEYERAVFYFHAYLRNKPDAPNRDVVEQLIKELDGLIAAQKKSSERPPTGVQTPSGVPAPRVAVADAPPRRWYEDKIGWAVGGAGVVAVGVGIGFIVHGAAQANDAGGTKDQSTADDLNQAAKRSKLIGGILVGAGAALAIAGAVKMVLYDRPGHEEPKVSFVVGPRWIGVAGRF
jgi:tetratricopeptide (TPR) repeat protein